MVNLNYLIYYGPWMDARRMLVLEDSAGGMGSKVLITTAGEFIRLSHRCRLNISRGVERFIQRKAREEEVHYQPTATMLRCSGGYTTRADMVQRRLGTDKSSTSDDNINR